MWVLVGRILCNIAEVVGHRQLYHKMQDEAAKIMDDLVTPIPVDLSGRKIQGDELHHIAPKSSDPHIGQL